MKTPPLVGSVSAVTKVMLGTVALLGSSALGQSYSFSTLAGNLGGPGNADGTGASASIGGVLALTADAAGDTYVIDLKTKLRRITPAGVVTTVMYLPDLGFSNPTAVVTDAAGNFYIADDSLRTISKVTPGGTVSTLAGQKSQSGSADGTGAAARFSAPAALAIDTAGNLYVADRALVIGVGIGLTIRKVNPDGVVTTLAGKPGVQGTTDGTGSNALFFDPVGIAVDRSGVVYVVEGSDDTVRKVTPDGVVTTIAGTPFQKASVDGTGPAARFRSPLGVAVDAAGKVYIADANNNQIRAMTSAGVVTTVAGTTTAGSADGTGSSARFSYPVAVAVDPSGNLIVSDNGNFTIRKVTSAGVVTTLAGAPPHVGSANGMGPAASFDHPTGVAVDAAGNVYVADSHNNQCRKITPDGMVNIFANDIGSSTWVDTVATDPWGNVYVVAALGREVHKYNPAGSPVWVVGNGTAGSTDGQGNKSMFNGIGGLAVDFSGNVFVADSGNHAIRQISQGGVVTTFAGSLGAAGSADGTGAAARFNSPQGLTIDAAGNLYVTDRTNRTIRKISPAGVVSTIAGKTGVSGSDDGTGTAASFSFAYAIAADAAGNLFVADSSNSLIRKVTPAGLVMTIGGKPGVTGGADGIGSNAVFNAPQGIAVDLNGNLYIADGGSSVLSSPGNNAIRKATPLSDTPVAPTIVYAPQGVAAVAGQTAAFGVAVSGSPAPTYQWNLNGQTISGATNATYAISAVQASHAGQYSVTARNSAGSITSAAATLTVTSPAVAPVFTSVSTSTTSANEGEAVVLTAVASGTPAPTYQWSKGSTSSGNISGATSSTLTLGYLYPSSAGLYTVTATNLAGTATTSLSVAVVQNFGLLAPSVKTQPLSQSVTQGGSATFSVTTDGITAPYYQWYFGAMPIPGANSSSYTVTSAQAHNAGSYYVELSNRIGAASSAAATLTVTPSANAPKITVQPQSQSVAQGATVTLSAAASGTPAPQGQWYFGMLPIPGATSATYTVTNAKALNAGLYSFMASNAVGFAVSSAATVAVSTAPQFVTQPQSQSAGPGATVTFTATASGDPGYQWTFNGSPIAGATEARYVLTGAQPANSGSYAVRATNSAGSATSTPAFLTVAGATGAPTITVQPSSYAMIAGSTVVFSVGSAPTAASAALNSATDHPAAALSSTTSYQWYFNNAAISAATSPTLTVTASADAVGTYRCMLTNALGAVLTDPAVLSLSESANFGRLANLSILAQLAAREVMTVGTVIGGAGTRGTKGLLARAAGPSLAQFGVTGLLPNPLMTLDNTSGASPVALAIAGAWNGEATLRNAFAAVGAFAYLDATSRDAAIFMGTLTPGNYTVQVRDVNGATGSVIAELYDATSAGSFTTATPRLVNVSVLKSVETGGIVTAGFVLGGSTPKTILVRAIGPRIGLAPYNVAGAMAAPTVTLRNNSGVALATNSAWGGDPQLAAAGSSVGAFAISDPASKDAMVLQTLSPGNYTAQVGPAAGTSGGIVLVEVYEVP